VVNYRNKAARAGGTRPDGPESLPPAIPAVD
jgi:hypothetical protein